MTPARVAAAGLVVLLAAPADAFVRSVSRERPEACLWWRARQVPIVVNPSAASAAECGSTQAVLDLVRASYATWNAAGGCTDFAFLDAGLTGSQTVGFVPGAANENLVVFRVDSCARLISTGVIPEEHPCRQLGADPGDCADAFNCWPQAQSESTIALTWTAYQPRTGEIFDADLELHGKDAPGESGFWFTCTGDPAAPECPGRPNVDVPTPGCVSMDLGSTVVHEAGHALGLAHNCGDVPQAPTCAPGQELATMYFRAAIGEVGKRTLETDDVSGVCAIYPAGAPTAVCVETPPPQESGGCGCASAGAGDAALLGVVAWLLRARRRSRRRTRRPA